jgi:hypothetical protein
MCIVQMWNNINSIKWRLEIMKPFVTPVSYELQKCLKIVGSLFHIQGNKKVKLR